MTNPVIVVIRKLAHNASEAGSVARDAVGVFALRLGGLGLTFGLQVLVARLLGTAGYGDYIFVLSTVMILSLFVNGGFPTATLRFAPTYQSGGKAELLRGLIERSRQLVLLTSITGAVALTAFAWLSAARLGDDLARTFQAGAPLVALLALLLLYESRIRVFRGAVLARTPQEVIFPVVAGIAITLMYLAQAEDIRSYEAMLATAIAGALSLMAAQRFFSRAATDVVLSGTKRYETRNWVTTALQISLVSNLILAIGLADILLIGILVGTEEAGIYAAASRISKFVAFGLTAINLAAAPAVARLYSQGKTKDLQRLVVWIARGSLVTTVPIALILIIGGQQLLNLFGADFRDGFPALVILIIGQTINGLSGSTGLLVLMTGLQKKAMAPIAIASTINIAMHLALIPLLGIIGAAISTAATTILWNLSLVRIVRNGLGIHPTVLVLLDRRRRDLSISDE